MKVLIGCEVSGVVRDEFAKRGHNAWSCDLQPAKGKHLQCDVLEVLGNGWDLFICHPPCDYLTVSGNRWFKETEVAAPGILTGKARTKAQEDSIIFVKRLWNAPIPRIALENPIGVLSSKWMKPSQTIDMLAYGHGQQKATCLWLKNLPLLVPPNFKDLPVLEAFNWQNLSFAHRMAPSPDRKQKRSVTFRNLAYAMATQWAF